ncbi:hypothetical protein ACN4EK_05365 [Pantanalinema rosaneae CENA516]|uniref:hypothetical protein n=1 Tax=Pantanalinema rosaneae TaxID=1620701 RepID=UPI003D702145
MERNLPANPHNSANLVKDDLGLQMAPFVQRLAQRGSGFVGVVQLQSFQAQYARIPGWMVQRSLLLEQLRTRYGRRSDAATGVVGLVLTSVIPSPSPTPSSTTTPSPSPDPVSRAADTRVSSNAKDSPISSASTESVQSLHISRHPHPPLENQETDTSFRDIAASSTTSPPVSLRSGKTIAGSSTPNPQLHPNSDKPVAALSTTTTPVNVSSDENASTSSTPNSPPGSSSDSMSHSGLLPSTFSASSVTMGVSSEIASAPWLAPAFKPGYFPTISPLPLAALHRSAQPPFSLAASPQTRVEPLAHLPAQVSASPSASLPLLSPSTQPPQTLPLSLILPQLIQKDTTHMGQSSPSTDLSTQPPSNKDVIHLGQSSPSSHPPTSPPVNSISQDTSLPLVHRQSTSESEDRVADRQQIPLIRVKAQDQSIPAPSPPTLSTRISKWFRQLLPFRRSTPTSHTSTPSESASSPATAFPTARLHVPASELISASKSPEALPRSSLTLSSSSFTSRNSERANSTTDTQNLQGASVSVQSAFTPSISLTKPAMPLVLLRPVSHTSLAAVPSVTEPAIPPVLPGSGSHASLINFPSLTETATSLVPSPESAQVETILHSTELASASLEKNVSSGIFSTAEPASSKVQRMPNQNTPTPENPIPVGKNLDTYSFFTPSTLHTAPLSQPDALIFRQFSTASSLAGHMPPVPRSRQSDALLLRQILATFSYPSITSLSPASFPASAFSLQRSQPLEMARSTNSKLTTHTSAAIEAVSQPPLTASDASVVATEVLGSRHATSLPTLTWQNNPIATPSSPAKSLTSKSGQSVVTPSILSRTPAFQSAPSIATPLILTKFPMSQPVESITTQPILPRSLTSEAIQSVRTPLILAKSPASQPEESVETPSRSSESLVSQSDQSVTTRPILSRPLASRSVRREIQSPLPLANKAGQVQGGTGKKGAIARSPASSQATSGFVMAAPDQSPPTLSNLNESMPASSPPAATPPAPTVNIEQIAEQVRRLLLRQLWVERERRGG